MSFELTLFKFYPIIFLLVFYIVFITMLHIFKDKPLNIKNRIFKLEEYVPADEVHSLYQIGFLILSFALLLDLSYFLLSQSVSYYGEYIDILLSLLVIMVIYKKGSLKNLFFVFCLIPFSATFYLVFPNITLYLFDFLHIIGLGYASYYFIRRFYHYTRHNNLGLTMLLLFAILCISLFVTSITEQVGLLDAIVMISNAFTSNGYTVLGSSEVGKVNSVILVWGGYILSGVGTATLCVAILSRHFNKRFNKLEQMIKELKEE